MVICFPIAAGTYSCLRDILLSQKFSNSQRTPLLIQASGWILLGPPAIRSGSSHPWPLCTAAAARSRRPAQRSTSVSIIGNFSKSSGSARAGQPWEKFSLMITFFNFSKFTFFITFLFSIPYFVGHIFIGEDGSLDGCFIPSVDHVLRGIVQDAARFLFVV